MRGSWTTWALAGSLLANALAGGYLIYRLARTPPDSPRHYERDRADMFERLTDRRARIVMVGDSLTDRGEWDELLRIEGVANRGLAGDTIRGALARVPTVTALAPEVIVVMIGINDLYGGRSVEAGLGDHAALRAALRAGAPRARLLVQSLLPVEPAIVSPDKVTAFNAGLRDACTSGACEYIDVYAALALPDGRLDPTLTGDGIHLRGAGYLRWADVLRPHLER